ncbi:MAG TPA: hypothetical protein PL009_09690 [Flavipsychrobacter sp.]|nr:hypothetical protein [Flavipsychrobacter sp.]
MLYHVIISDDVKKFLKELDKKTNRRIWEKITDLANRPRPDGYIKLKGLEA